MNPEIADYWRFSVRKWHSGDYINSFESYACRSGYQYKREHFSNFTRWYLGRSPGGNYSVEQGQVENPIF